MKYNILIADDMSVNRMILKAILEKNLKNIEIYGAENGVEALGYIQKYPMDIIILDLMMPEKDGFEVLEELQQSAIPVLIYSSVEDIQNLQKAFELGGMDYLDKELTIQQLEIILPHKIKNMLKIYKA